MPFSGICMKFCGVNAIFKTCSFKPYVIGIKNLKIIYHTKSLSSYITKCDA